MNTLRILGTRGVPAAQIVYAGDYGDALCLNPFPAGTWTNEEIVAGYDINQAIIEASRGQMGQEIVEISRRMHQLKKEIDFLYGELDTLTRDIEDKKAHYDRELAGLTS